MTMTELLPTEPAPGAGYVPITDSSGKMTAWGLIMDGLDVPFVLERTIDEDTPEEDFVAKFDLTFSPATAQLRNVSALQLEAATDPGAGDVYSSSLLSGIRAVVTHDNDNDLLVLNGGYISALANYDLTSVHGIAVNADYIADNESCSGGVFGSHVSAYIRLDEDAATRTAAQMMGSRVYANPSIDSLGGTLTIDDVFGQLITVNIVETEGTLEVTDVYGTQITVSATGTPAVTNAYGLLIGNINSGSVLNYAIYTGVGIIHFGDDANTDGDFEFNNATDGPILTDRTLATRHRITLDNGALGIEAA
jgi:hypothetical protein